MPFGFATMKYGELFFKSLLVSSSNGNGKVKVRRNKLPKVVSLGSGAFSPNDLESIMHELKKLDEKANIKSNTKNVENREVKA